LNDKKIRNIKMAISAAQVKELREKTGAGMMDCKKALTEADGDFEKAIEILRKKGASVAAKRAERSANEGVVIADSFNDGKSGAIVEVNCETDFVAKSDDFIKFSQMIYDVVVSEKPNSVDELMELTYDGKKLADSLNDVVAKIGEKIEVSRFRVEETENGVVTGYIHHGSKLGVLVVAENAKEESKNDLSDLLKDIAMQAAAMKPSFLFREEVPQDTLNKEIEIYKEVARKEGKPEQILEKIAQGKLNKYFEENCLFEQVYVKDNSKKVSDLIKEFNAKNGSEVKLKLFHRFHLSDENKK
jgi:elongation factor Ts